MHPRVKEVLDALACGQPVTTVDLQVVQARFRGRQVKFCVNFERDPIQNNHRQGTFYERPELAAMRKVFPRGGTFVDIGANVGNHTLWAAMFLRAARVIPIEPNPVAFELLIANVLVNGLTDRVDLSRLGLGVSDAPGSGFGAEQRRRNLGAARLIEGGGDLQVHRADELLDDITPDFVKIDVEGMEIKVLSGLDGLLSRCRPTILVEVDDTNERGFSDWAERQEYGVVHTQQRYKTNKNFLVADTQRVEELKDRLAPRQPA